MIGSGKTAARRMDSRLNTRTSKRVRLPTRVGQLTVSTGKVTLLPYDPSSGEDLQMVEDPAGWSRTYGEPHIYVQKQSKKALSGTVEWHDIFSNFALSSAAASWP